MKYAPAIMTGIVFVLFLLAWEFLPPAFDVPRYILPTANQSLDEMLRMIRWTI